MVTVPFDPDQVWSAKATHAVNGTINGHLVRGKLERSADGWAFALPAMWARDCAVAAGMDLDLDIAPEGAQRAELAPDIAAALEASPQAAAFFDTLAQFYTKDYLRWIDSTSRKPALRAERISAGRPAARGRHQAAAEEPPDRGDSASGPDTEAARGTAGQGELSIAGAPGRQNPALLASRPGIITR